MAENEETEIKKRYERRESAGISGRYSPFNPAYRFFSHDAEEGLLSVLSRHGITDLSDSRILDVGCGRGDWLRKMVSYGARPDNLHGVELMEKFVEQGRPLMPPGVTLQAGSAERLDYPDGHFDIVMQFMMFTSILDSGLKERIAAEMLRVTRPGGAIIWYDFRYDNPRNPDVKGIGKAEVRELFKGCDADFVSVILAPPLIRAFIRIPAVCRILRAVPFLRSHLIAFIKKQQTVA